MNVRRRTTSKYDGTHIIDPFDSRLELRQAEMDLDAEDNVPI